MTPRTWAHLETLVDRTRALRTRAPFKSAAAVELAESRSLLRSGSVAETVLTEGCPFASEVRVVSLRAGILTLGCGSSARVYDMKILLSTGLLVRLQQASDSQIKTVRCRI